MGVLYVSFGYKVRPRTFGCVAMGSAVLFILRSRLLVYSAVDLPACTQARVQPRNTYNHTYIKFWHGQNNLTLNPDKTTCTLFTPALTNCKSCRMQH